MSRASKASRAFAYGTHPDFTTTVDTYDEVATGECGLVYRKSFYFTVTTNELTVKVLGSLDGGVTFVADLIAEFSQAAGSIYKTGTTGFTHYQVLVKPTVGSTHGTLATQWGVFES